MKDNFFKFVVSMTQKFLTFDLKKISNICSSNYFYDDFTKKEILLII